MDIDTTDDCVATLREAIGAARANRWSEEEVRRRADEAGVTLSSGTVRFFTELGGDWGRVFWCGSWDPFDLDAYLNLNASYPTWQEYVGTNVSVSHGDGAALIPDPAPWLRLIEWADPKVVLLDERTDDPLIVTYDPEIQGTPLMPYGLRWTGVTLWRWMAMLAEAISAGDIAFTDSRAIPGMTQLAATPLTNRIQCFLEGPFHAFSRGGWPQDDLLLGLTGAGWYDPRWATGASPELVVALWDGDHSTAETLVASAERGVQEGSLLAARSILAGIRMIDDRSQSLRPFARHETIIADLTARISDLVGW